MRHARRFLVAALAGALGACGGSGGGGGPTLLDFEDRPDDGVFPALAVPLALGAGATITDVSPAGALVDFSTADGFSLVACSAEASSGSLLLGVNGAAAIVTIVFDSPVSSVSVLASATDGDLVELEAFDAANLPLATAFESSECPSLRADDFLGLDFGSPVIKSVEIRGEFVVFDDLIFE